MLEQEVSIIDIREMGKYKRSYDDIKDIDEDDEDEKAAAEEAQILADVLRWTLEKTAFDVEYGIGKHSLKHLALASIELDNFNKVTAFRNLKSSPIKQGLFESAGDLLKDIYYAGRDLFAQKKVRTAVTILAGIAAGAAVGAVIGTIVVPIIGTAGGGFIGAVGAGTVVIAAMLGGTIGLSVLGALGGGWLARFASKKLYKDEHRFGLSKRTTIKLRERSDVHTNTAEMMNGYLYNRKKTVKNKILKEIYKELRREGVQKANPYVMEKVALFFCNELNLLKKEVHPYLPNPALDDEIKAVVAILHDLKESKKFSRKTRRKIKETLATYAYHEAPQLVVTEAPKELPPRKKTRKETVRFMSPPRKASSHPFQPNQIAKIEQKLKEVVKKTPEVKAVAVKEKTLGHDAVFQCQLKGEAGNAVNIIFQQKKMSEDQVAPAVYMSKRKFAEQDPDLMSSLLVEGLEALEDSKHVEEEVYIIDAAGDDAIAIRLLAAAIKGNVRAELNEEEYPNTPEMNKRREAILREAKKLAEKEPTKKLKST